MNSPFTNGEVQRIAEERVFKFCKEDYTIIFHYYKCIDTGKQFTDDELDGLNLGQVYDAYRNKYGIPFPNEIKNIRLQYGLSAKKMSEILGIGVNIYRNYEAGEMPSVSNGRMIQIIKDPIQFKKLIYFSRNEFIQPDFQKIVFKVKKALRKHKIVVENIDSLLEFA